MLFKKRIKAEPKYIGQGQRLGFCADMGLIKRKVDRGKEQKYVAGVRKKGTVLRVERK